MGKQTLVRDLFDFFFEKWGNRDWLGICLIFFLKSGETDTGWGFVCFFFFKVGKQRLVRDLFVFF